MKTYRLRPVMLARPDVGVRSTAGMRTLAARLRAIGPSRGSVMATLCRCQWLTASPRSETIVPTVLIARVRFVFRQILRDRSALPAELKPMLRQRD